jgi:sulfate permease, SulP family
MTKTKFNQKQEVFALSLGNVFSGMFGGIPATAALARTALNIKSGATSRVSGIICSAGVAALSLAFLPYFKFLPLPNIAAILVNVAIRMIDFDEIKHIYSNTVRTHRSALLPLHDVPASLLGCAGSGISSS